ncbi:hypothetical protein ASZ90_001630 [hydrocarbon metagenome]|uniref:Uncharacterized protein n=1 Tax=hydrocarbon metagenome TaxID=938273 RepID=A0A0W8G5P5_9ZZZZ
MPRACPGNIPGRAAKRDRRLDRSAGLVFSHAGMVCARPWRAPPAARIMHP